LINREEKIAKLLLDMNIVVLRPNKPFRWVSGIIAPIYTDCRLIMSYPKERKIVLKEMQKMLSENVKPDFEVIAGVATSGIPYAAWLAELTNKPLVYVRSEKKDHGKENQVEGKLEKNQKTVLVEDLISTGGSSVGCIKALREAGAIVDNALSIFTYELEASQKNFRETKVNQFSLTRFSVLVETAVKTGYLKEKEKLVALDWKNGPLIWGKKYGFG